MQHVHIKPELIAHCSGEHQYANSVTFRIHAGNMPEDEWRLVVVDIESLYQIDIHITLTRWYAQHAPPPSRSHPAT